jgi:hypothetical protein
LRRECRRDRLCAGVQNRIADDLGLSEEDLVVPDDSECKRIYEWIQRICFVKDDSPPTVGTPKQLP